MIKKHLALFFATIFVILGFFALPAQAQVRGTDIVIITTPQYPSPNQDVTVKASSRSVDLDKANISCSYGL